MPFIACKNITNWTELDEYINPTRFSYAILEKIAEIKFEKWDDKKITDLNATIEGILFGAKAELKWKKKGDGFHIVIISDEDQSTLPSQDFEVKNIEMKGDRKIYLWGEKQFENKQPQSWWFELRIPKILKYPFSNINNNKDRVVVVIKEYKLEQSLLNNKTVESKLYRWAEIQEVYKDK